MKRSITGAARQSAMQLRLQRCARATALATSVATLTLLSAAANSAGLNARTAIERAVLQIELGDLALARSYLERPLIDPGITTTERSRAYYLHGYALELAGFPVSAAQNYAKALAFNADNPATLAALGHLYAIGNGVEKDPLKAHELLRRSAELGHAPGMTRLGAMLITALPTSASREDDLQEARRWLTKATEANDGEALLFLAQSYRAPYTKNPDPQKALDYYEEALILNQAAAFNSIGNMHLRGELGTKDTEAAIRSFKRGAGAGESAAQVSLGYLYLVGQHLPANPQEARRLFENAAQSNDVRAHHYLGYLTEIEDPAVEDASQIARTHYLRAAEGNYPAALKRLSELAFLADKPAEGVHYLQALRSATEPQTNQHYWQATHHLAWLFATHPDSALRSGSDALELATVSVAHKRSTATLDTLAAAYAETSDFTAAVATQNEVLALAQGEDEGERYLDDYTARLAAYREQRPWRATGAEGSSAEGSTVEDKGTVAPQ